MSDICEIFRNNYRIIKKENNMEILGLSDNEEKDLKKEKMHKRIKKKKKALPICEFYKGEDIYDNFFNYNKFEDIEDLLKFGTMNAFCPYFYNIYKTRKCANLTIMTYNYILDQKIIEKLDILEKNSIVILDEAHNISDNLEI